MKRDSRTNSSTKNGCEIYELTEDDVAKFKAVVQPLIDQYKEVYGADACTAFGVQ